MKKIVFSLSLVFLILAGVSAYALAASDYVLTWYSISGGGGQITSSDGMYSLSSTVGQPVVGIVSQNGSKLCSGFWCQVWSYFNLHLPIIQR